MIVPLRYKVFGIFCCQAVSSSSTQELNIINVSTDNERGSHGVKLLSAVYQMTFSPVHLYVTSLINMSIYR